jgi:hypothetical protein
VTRNKREFGIGKLAVDHVEIGSTDSTGMDAEEEFAFSGNRTRPFAAAQR